jgi:hypothetical protein
MLDLNSGVLYTYGWPPAAPPTIADLVNGHIDAALQRQRDNEVPREYLGASRIGEECARKLAYEYLKVPGEPFSSKTLRIFAAGHKFEDMLADWLRDAGFDLRSHKPSGGQYGFEAMKGRIKGHIDGVFMDGPDLGLVYPGGWECKALNDRSWSDTKKKGVKLSKPVYFGQCQTYMGYMNLPWFLFSALNKNTQEVYHEVVRFDAAIAQVLSDRAVNIIRDAEAGQLPPRISDDPNFFKCRFCDHREPCWKDPR